MLWKLILNSDMSDPVILSYFDSLLRQSDIALLEKPNWLNDKIIGFAFQYYQEVNYSFYDDMGITKFRRIQVQPSVYGRFNYWTVKDVGHFACE